ncbi:MAG: formylglycine-generating enzyme family protein [Bacteroidales bacterium]|nr:formylglycine-generating enzyme family protein [Bacteroidales bacterium]
MKIISKILPVVALMAGLMMFSCEKEVNNNGNQSGSTPTPTPTPTPPPPPSGNVDSITVNGVTFKMVKVEGGTFMMGAPITDSEAYSNELPQHCVTLSEYYIAETEVTQALWQAVMGSNPSHFKFPDRPVEEISWNDCKTFIEKLNQLTDKQFRLPTEAEWEYAARGGGNSHGYKFSGSDNVDDVAWYTDNCGGETHAVKTKAANELGLYDMTGNVLEWCSDWMAAYTADTVSNPQGPAAGFKRVLRGGSLYNDARRLRVTRRSEYNPTFTDYSVGFRLAL